jgi:hypothetical protein
VTLGEVIEKLEALDAHATIYAQKPWSVDARAVVSLEPDDGSVPPETAGLDYFLEVDVALWKPRAYLGPGRGLRASCTTRRTTLSCSTGSGRR